MSRQCQFKLPFDEVPKLDCAIIGPRNKELVHRIDSNASHPARVPTYDPLEFPRSMPLLLHFFLMSQRNLIFIASNRLNKAILEVIPENPLAQSADH